MLELTVLLLELGVSAVFGVILFAECAQLFF